MAKRKMSLPQVGRQHSRLGQGKVEYLRCNRRTKTTDNCFLEGGLESKGGERIAFISSEDRMG